MKKLLLLFLICPSAFVYGQKPSLDSSVYDSWQNINQTLISDDANWVVYSVIPQQGDGWMYIYNVVTGKKDSVARGSNPAFSEGCKYVAYQIIPAFAETRQAKKKKLKEDQMPKNNLEIRILESQKVISFYGVKSFSVPLKNSYWMAFLLEKKSIGKDSTRNGEAAKTTGGESSKPKKNPEPKGTEFVIYNPVSSREFRFRDVTEYAVARDGNAISFVQDIPDTSKLGNVTVLVFDARKEKTDTVFSNKGSLKKISSDNSGIYTSFIYSADTAKNKIYDLWLSKSGGKAVRIVDSGNASLPYGWSVSENGNIVFSDDGTRLYFGTASKPEKEAADTLLDDEKYKLDVWSWDDALLQPMQKKQLEQELKRTYQAVYHTDRNATYQLADSAIPSVRINPKSTSDYLLGSSNLRYEKLMSWDSRNYSDYYLINAETGAKSLIFSKYPSQVILSPGGRYLLSWDPDEKIYVVRSVSGDFKKLLSVPGNLKLYDEQNDLPDDPSPYGVAGWTENDRKVLIYDRYDIWMFNIEGKEDPVTVTNNIGRSEKLRFRYLKLDPEAQYIPEKEQLLLSAFNEENKESGFYSIRLNRREDPVNLLFGKSSFSRGITKAREAEKIIWQKESFKDAPDLYLSSLNFSGTVRISQINPQQQRFNWLNAELVDWTSFDGQRLQGILYKPENFDPLKKYPMIVYFYERSSDGLYSYFPPAPSASIINRSFAVSNGYLLFVPDIPYKIGYPGQSCYDAVVSGTCALIERYSFIDKNKLGLDGQSWGGYQIAWLVTRTDLFKCAYAGAAVSDMISAYGGIRWESGMSRMFQYEHTQSRIGGNLWEKTLHFIENSPVFFVPRINTPLLLMHNDADGAVPWYQGIEFITALRRLNKPAWLLSYNDEAHNLVKRPNRKDLSIRKMQFFDHYLKGKPMPYWMAHGITQTEKGKKSGYELVVE